MAEVKTIVKNVSWVINSACNFKCAYCINQASKNPNLSLGNPDIQPAIDFFNKTGVWEINLVGGEPFLHPKFIELCQKLTQKHSISIITNLSLRLVYEFAETINPKSVKNILCSMHFVEIKRMGLIDEFIKKFNLLKNKGFPISSSLVMWPPLFSEADEIYSYFKKSGVELIPSSFIGTYNGKTYPESYTREERCVMEKYSPIKKENYPHLIKGRITYRGKICNAGFNHIIIRQSGEISRCHSDKSSLGNIYKGNMGLFSKPKRCAFPECVCPSEGYYFSDKKPRLFQNSVEGRLENIERRKNILKAAV